MFNIFSWAYFSICTSPLVKGQFKSFTHFFFQLGCLFPYNFWEFFPFWIKVFIRYVFCKYFSQCIACFLFLTVSVEDQTFLVLPFFSFMACDFCISSKKSLPMQSHKDSSLYFPRSIGVLPL